MRGFSEETFRQKQEEVDIWGRGRAGRVLRRIANTRTDGICCRGGLLDPRARGLRDIGHLDAQAAAGRGIGPRTIMTLGTRYFINFGYVLILIIVGAAIYAKWMIVLVKYILSWSFQIPNLRLRVRAVHLPLSLPRISGKSGSRLRG